jgi:hypothetical protein
MSGDFIKGFYMWQFLDIVARLILLGGVALVFFWIRSIFSAEDSRRRACVACGSSLYALELATCADCLANIRCNDCMSVMFLEDTDTRDDCPDCGAIGCLMDLQGVK